MAKNIPSYAQVKLLAHVWANGTTKVGVDYVDATTKACVKRGWFTTNGETGKYPNGSDYHVCILSDAGYGAIEDYLRNARYKRLAVA